MKEWDIVEIPVFSRPRGVFFTRSSRSLIAIAAYEDGYAAIELGEEIAFRGWRGIHLPERKAIVRVREGRGWRERYFFACDRHIGEILPDKVVFQEEVPLFEEGGLSWKIVPSWGAPAIRCSSPFGHRMLEGSGDLFAFMPAPGADLGVVLYSGPYLDEEWEWHRLRPCGDHLQQKLQARGRIVMGARLVGVWEGPSHMGRAYVAGWGWNTTHLVAMGIWAMGLSPTGNQMALLQKKGERWVWNFRRVRGTCVVPEAVFPAFPEDLAGRFPGQLGDRPWEWVYRISPDLRWSVIAAPDKILVVRIPRPAPRGRSARWIPNPRRILPTPPGGDA